MCGIAQPGGQAGTIISILKMREVASGEFKSESSREVSCSVSYLLSLCQEDVVLLLVSSLLCKLFRRPHPFQSQEFYTNMLLLTSL